MGLLYPWATKEYLLWNMSLGQIIMYFNLGMDTKYPKPKNEGTLSNMSHDQLQKFREEMISLGLMEKEQKQKDAQLEKEALSKKYGEI